MIAVWITLGTFLGMFASSFLVAGAREDEMRRRYSLARSLKDIAESKATGGEFELSARKIARLALDLDRRGEE